MAHREVIRAQSWRGNTFFYHIDDGLHYHESLHHNGTIFYECVRAATGCRGRAKFDAVRGFIHTSGHNHEPDPLYPAEMTLRRIILQRCENLDFRLFPRIVQEEGRSFDPEVAARCTYVKMRTLMRNARIKILPYYAMNNTM